MAGCRCCYASRRTGSGPAAAPPAPPAASPPARPLLRFAAAESSVGHSPVGKGWGAAGQGGVGRGGEARRGFNQSKATAPRPAEQMAQLVRCRLGPGPASPHPAPPRRTTPHPVPGLTPRAFPAQAGQAEPSRAEESSPLEGLWRICTLGQG